MEKVDLPEKCDPVPSAKEFAHNGSATVWPAVKSMKMTETMRICQFCVRKRHQVEKHP